jgi:hypothetical protein
MTKAMASLPDDLLWALDIEARRRGTTRSRNLRESAEETLRRKRSAHWVNGGNPLATLDPAFYEETNTAHSVRGGIADGGGISAYDAAYVASARALDDRHVSCDVSELDAPELGSAAWQRVHMTVRLGRGHPLDSPPRELRGDPSPVRAIRGQWAVATRMRTSATCGVASNGSTRSSHVASGCAAATT